MTTQLMQLSVEMTYDTHPHVTDGVFILQSQNAPVGEWEPSTVDDSSADMLAYYGVSVWHFSD